jgi:hypothetical protein
MRPEKPPVENRKDADGLKPEEVDLTLPGKLLVGGVWMEIDDAPDGQPPLRIVDGLLHMDKKRLDEEKTVVNKALSDSIANGDIDIFTRLTRGLDFAVDKDLIVLRNKLQKAFKKQSKTVLEEINVNLLTDGVAERNIIREGLKPQIQLQPFIFRDREGNILDPDTEVDYIFVKGKGNTYKVIVGSKKGIAGIELPNDLPKNVFRPDVGNIEKDPVTDAITIPLGDAKDGSSPLVTTIEIRKGPINIIEKASREEQKAQAEKVRKKKAKAYAPSKPKVPKKNSESGGYGYVSSSG